MSGGGHRHGTLIRDLKVIERHKDRRSATFLPVLVTDRIGNAAAQTHRQMQLLLSQRSEHQFGNFLPPHQAEENLLHGILSTVRIAAALPCQRIQPWPVRAAEVVCLTAVFGTHDQFTVNPATLVQVFVPKSTFTS